ncbi:hypothetical protein B0H19DRAFT_1033896 [Mycena capillaripes]|nr:hypothetical protein B0H19DRAFT_1033896 [Mycena capillaripes]
MCMFSQVGVGRRTRVVLKRGRGRPGGEGIPRGVVQRPMRENLATLGLFLLRGFLIICIVILGLFLVLLVVVLVKQRSGTGRPRSLTDDALPKVATQTSTPLAEVLIELDEEISPELPVIADSEGGR